MNEAVSIVFATHRPDPAFEWFADGLANQLSDEDVEVIVVDGLFDEERTALFTAAAAGRFPVRHVAAKPTPYNGPHRVTRAAYFAASSARNTGVVYATKPYLVFVDDSSLPMPGWWSEVLEAARHQYLVSGAYKKCWDVRVERGELVSHRAHALGLDSRWDQGDDQRVVPLIGGQLYNPSFGVPRAVLIEVGGFDELCDSVAGEDYQLGIRLENAGHRLFYSRAMLTIESENHAVGTSLERLDATLPEVRYLELLRQFGVDKRTTDGRLDASHMVLDILYGRHQRHSIGNAYELGRLGPDQLEGLADRFPERHWFTGLPLSEM